MRLADDVWRKTKKIPMALEDADDFKCALGDSAVAARLSKRITPHFPPQDCLSKPRRDRAGI